MPRFLILSNSSVHDILINLGKDQILRIRDALVQCLTEFSIGSERQYQPPVGIVNRPEGNKTLFRPFTSAGSVGVKVITDPPPSSPAAGALHGILAICDLNGIPTGILNAEEITGYRTALSAGPLPVAAPRGQHRRLRGGQAGAVASSPCAGTARRRGQIHHHTQQVCRAGTRPAREDPAGEREALGLSGPHRTPGFMQFRLQVGSQRSPRGCQRHLLHSGHICARVLYKAHTGWRPGTAALRICRRIMAKGHVGAGSQSLATRSQD